MSNETKARSRSHAVKGVHLWLVLWKAARAVETLARRNVEDLGMGLSDFAVLEALLHKGPLPVQALGAKVLLTSGSMTAAVDRLERRELVARRDDPGDRRARIVHLTSRGRVLITRLFASHAREMELAAAPLTPPERTRLLSLLRKFGRGAEGRASASTSQNRTRGKGTRAALPRQERKRRRK